jgi:hypothetical protein
MATKLTLPKPIRKTFGTPLGVYLLKSHKVDQQVIARLPGKTCLP